MAIVRHREAIAGGWQTFKVTEVKNLGYLFKHADKVTELHLNASKDGFELRAVFMDGRLFITDFASRSVFADTFNRNKTLKDIAVFYDKCESQSVGTLTATPTEPWKLINYDVWGNPKDGFEVNDQHYTGLSIELEPEREYSDKEIAKLLVKSGFCNKTAIGRITTEWHDNCVYINEKRHGKPFCELRLERD